ncbi:MAG TPA: hypothetical protein VKM55_28030 [Candidatus Lokiarchaeia archaeon]|nr:hypothetical protein [Candidatus Lokiarchaeia archaeon]
MGIEGFRQPDYSLLEEITIKFNFEYSSLTKKEELQNNGNQYEMRSAKIFSHNNLKTYRYPEDIIEGDFQIILEGLSEIQSDITSEEIISKCSKICLSDDSMKDLDEDESRIMLEALKGFGEPTEIEILKDAKIKGKKLLFDLDLEIDKE